METIIKDFKKLKEAGKISLGKVGKAWVISARRFDPLTGVEVSSDVFAIDKEMLLKLKESASDLIVNIDFVLAEVEKLKN